MLIGDKFDMKHKPDIKEKLDLKYKLCVCHGCRGNGWLENSMGDFRVCPICDGHGQVRKCNVDNKLDEASDSPLVIYHITCSL